MPKCKFYIVDVFAERKFEGNQLAVFLCDEVLFEAEMQKVAKEMNYSETTFLRYGPFSLKIIRTIRNYQKFLTIFIKSIIINNINVMSAKRMKHI